MPKLIRSYALDAIEEQQSTVAEGDMDLDAFLQAVATAPADSFAALGEGEDFRVHSSTIAGGALAARNRVIHLCAFNQKSGDNEMDHGGRMRRSGGQDHPRAAEMRQRDAFDSTDGFDQ